MVAYMESQSLRESAAAMGRKGGSARVKKLTPEQRSEEMRAAANARWKKVRERAEAAQQTP